jgi:hypothetical protein
MLSNEIIKGLWAKRMFGSEIIGCALRIHEPIF